MSIDKAIQEFHKSCEVLRKIHGEIQELNVKRQTMDIAFNEQRQLVESRLSAVRHECQKTFDNIPRSKKMTGTMHPWSFVTAELQNYLRSL